MTYSTVYTEVEVDLSEIDTDDLIDELESRGEAIDNSTGDAKELVNEIYQLRRNNRDYQSQLDKLIYQVLGRIV